MYLGEVECRMHGGGCRKSKIERLVEARFLKSLVSPAKTFGLDPRGNSELRKEMTLHNGRGDCRVMGRI